MFKKNKRTKEFSDLRRRSFTLIELLTVIAIIGILASIVVVSVSSARVKARNARRKADLTSIKTALTLYYDKNKSYPTTNATWCGEVGSKYAPGDASGICALILGSDYIPGLAPDFIPRMLSDPNKNAAGRDVATSRGYIYRSDGKSYKMLTHNTVEGATQTTDPFWDPKRDGNNDCNINPTTPTAMYAYQISSDNTSYCIW